ncbi:recombination directionality factor [Rhizomonospora bruguierae]|uniref:recombination directionality factor n=1 Tax=Rhizomonospora bruguierae TaxID=1581705 RepID=UPI001BD052CB|nr:hypothetical protein [Micromonospora sp. NBRC 107566]
MSGRILTLQRQARELGRLRMGWSEPYTDKYGKEKRKPVKSTTWVLTTPQRAYLEPAVEAWGGQVEEWQPQGNGAKVWRIVTDTDAIDAILPPGDPLSQAYEMWSRGGCQRRCDGETEQLSNKPCLCRAEFGDEFHLQKPEVVCRPHTRLNVVLPDMPDLGVWRVETHGFYAANEIAAAVDLIRHATGGTVAVPVRLRIEPRTRVAQGKTKQFLVLALEIRGSTAGQILAGQPATVELEGTAQRRALEAAPAAANGTRPGPDFYHLAREARDGKTIRQLWTQANQAGALDQKLADFLKGRIADLEPPAPPAADVPQQPAAAPVEVVEGEAEPDADTVWAQINAHVGKNQKWSAEELEKRVIALLNKDSAEANGWELQRFLTALRNGEVA